LPGIAGAVRLKILARLFSEVFLAGCQLLTYRQAKSSELVVTSKGHATLLDFLVGVTDLLSRMLDVGLFQVCLDSNAAF
jgi:hypothetical protein